MKITPPGLLLFLLLLWGLPARTGSNPDVFMLTVTLQDPFNPQLVLSLPVTVGQPFSVTFTNGPIVTMVSGTLGPEIGGKYALLGGKISEGTASHPSFSSGLANPLQLNKPNSLTFISGINGSIRFQQTVLLTKFKAK